MAVQPSTMKNLFLRLLVVAVCGLSWSAIWAAPALADTYTVKNTSDSGTGSLREAISSANANTAGPNTIDFEIAGEGAQTISPTSALPTVTNPVLIDGASQPGFTGTPLIRLDGASAGTSVGLLITAGQSTIRGLEITGWSGGGIELQTGGANLIAGNYIGTDGSSALANGDGVRITGGSSGSTIGGTSAGAANLISGNSEVGVRITGAGTSANLLQGNLIGTNAAGTGALANGATGALVGGGATGNTIGGAGAGNVISGNTKRGVVIVGGETSANLLEGNYIGTGVHGSGAVGNGLDGVLVVNGANENTIGGTAAGTSNLISANGAAGVDLTASGPNLVAGNFIGTNAEGTAPLGNEKGIGIGEGATNNTIGGTAAGAGNLISGNLHRGVVIGAAGTSANVLQGNYIGVNAAGNGALPNGRDGILIWNSTANNTIGGSVAGAGNVISANTEDGVLITDTGTSGNVLQDNLIGLGSGGGALGNGVDGVGMVNGASSNTIGGTATGAGNTIANSGHDGVLVDGSSTTGDAILTNSIFASSIVGIALTNGGNANEPAPTVTSVQTSGTSTTISGTVTSAKTHVEVFSNPSCGDPEGKTFLGSPRVSHKSNSWSLTVANLPTGEGVTATATDNPTSNTSQFSGCRSAP